MVIMAIDHTREFWDASTIRPEDVSQASILFFLTRFITHFCAPTFIFLSGISIYLRERKHRAGIQRFVFTRGLWLMAVEFLFMGPMLTHGYNLVVFGILWVIGVSMVIVSALMRVPRWLLVMLSCLMIAGHHLLPVIQPTTLPQVMLSVLHNTPFFIPTTPSILVAYTIIPWVAVMMLGYCAGPWLDLEPVKRQSNFLKSGIILLLIFVVLRFTNTYGDLLQWSVQERGTIYTILSFLNVNKYPPSLLFLCMTLGVCMLLLAWCENANGSWKQLFLTFGKVPFFFFIIHFTIISMSSAIWSALFLGKYVNFGFSNPAQWPHNYEPSLARLYFVWIVVVIICYFPCRWFSSYRQRTNRWWLSYL